MISQAEFKAAQHRTAAFFQKAGIIITTEEAECIEIADFGLGEWTQTGLGLLTYLNTDRVCAKELVLMPGQTCPEHRHPPAATTGPGKEETFRCWWGVVYLYVPGEAAAMPAARPPANRRQHYTAWHEIILKPGEQYTLPSNTLHWFQGGSNGAVVSEFSTHSDDASDVFTDPEIRRLPV